MCFWMQVNFNYFNMLYIYPILRGIANPTYDVTYPILAFISNFPLLMNFLSYCDPVVDPFGGVALLLQQGLASFDDLSDSLKAGPIFGLGRGSFRR